MLVPTVRRPRGVRLLPAAILASTTIGLALPAAAQAPRADSAAFVTRLGNDTLAVERVVRTPGRVEAEVLLRTPTSSVTRYVLELDDAGNLRRYEATTRRPGSDDAVRHEVIERRGDSLSAVSTGTDGSGAQSRSAVMVAAPPTTLPFLDMIHWPYEVALMRARPEVGATMPLPLLSGRRPSDFGLERKTADSVAITHPTRGTMHARIDANGRLLGLDAAGTTRAVVVDRRPWVELEALAARYAAEDAAGRSFGALAGRGASEATVQGAKLEFDFGTPAVRGREIWGALVPYGRVWRTGANRATHLTTDRELTFGDLVVPAGEYTLFTIPEADGGLLIINRQTGQNGQQYDEARDLGRVRLQVRPLSAPQELFNITATETATGGELRLQWDRQELVAPFTVRAPRD